ncbi:MAG: DUF4412 domain-containing protein [bacterium]|nr:DUF4412 domain-containing protein [bacterium]
MRFRRIFSAALALLVLSAFPAFAGWVETSQEGVFYYGDGIVKQVPSPEAGGPESIMDFRKGTVTMVDHDSRTYTTFKFEEFCQVLKKMYAGAPPEMLAQMKQMNESRPKPNVTVKKVGKGEPVAGYATTKYQVMDNGQLERTVWMAEDAQLANFYRSFGDQANEHMKKMMVCKDLGMNGDTVDMSSSYLDLMKKGWLMMEEVVDEDSVSGVSAPVEELVEENLPASTFQVPQGYKKVSLDQFNMGDQ